MSRFLILSSVLLIFTSASMEKTKHKPTIFIIGDSTVKNGSGKGDGGLWGWGDYFFQQIDTEKISIRNFAIGGRSSRTFISEGRWDKVLSMIRPGDYVIMQFGHNDGGPLNDNSRARGTIKGIGEETQEIDNILTGKHEIVHSYGWYMRKYITDAKARGAIPVICSPIPRNMWENGKVIRAEGDYAKWARESAKTEKAFFIDLNEIIAAKYETIGEEIVKTKFFLTDHTHTTEAGAILNAGAVAEGIRSLKGCRLSKYLILLTNTDPYNPDFSKPEKIKGMTLVWNDEFNNTGKPDSANWRYENGFVRNQELQWYRPENVTCKNGVLLIEGRREMLKNTRYIEGSSDWKRSREFAEYTSASINSRSLRQFQFGRFEIRARIDTACGAWPAIWTLGVAGGWPSGGEIDIMEYYRWQGKPTILANFAWGTDKRGVAKWDDLKKPFSDFTKTDPDWAKKFHTWRMDWDKDSIKIFLDDLLLNDTAVKDCVNPDGFNPFLQPHYILLNLALGGNGGDPSLSHSPVTYEVDWVRVYQK